MVEASRVQFRQGDAAWWAASNTILAKGEPGYEEDTGKLKVGNGSTPWNSLSYEPSAADLATKAPLPGAVRNPLTGWWHVDGNGAVHNGTTSDHTAINNTILGASNDGGGIVYLTSGYTYAVSSTIQPRSGVTLYGPGAKLIKTASGAIISATTTGFTGFHIDGITFSGTVNEFPTAPKRTRTTSGTGATQAVYISGDLDVTGSGQAVMRDFTMRNCRVENMASLPINIRGVRGTVRVSNSTFYNNQDVGFLFNEEVIYTGNHMQMSADNGVSLSRGNRKVTCTGNTAENCAYDGIWAAGFETYLGPTVFSISGNTIRNVGHSGIRVDYAPQLGTITGNTIECGYFRGPSDVLDNAHGVGIWIGGYPTSNRAAPTNFATGINCSANTVRGAARYGIYATGIHAGIIGNNLLLDIGAQFLSDGTTAVGSTDTTTNVGVFIDYPTQSTALMVTNNSTIDTRATPYCNYGLVPQIPTTGLGYVYRGNHMYNCRNAYNIQESGNTQQINYAVQFLSGATVRSKLLTGGSAPTVAAGAQSASVSTASNTQNDIVGTVNSVAVASPVAGTIATVTFVFAHSTAPHVIVTPKDAATANTRPYAASVSTTGFNIATAVAPAGGASLSVDYFVIN